MSAWLYFGVPVGCLVTAAIIIAVVVLRSGYERKERIQPWYHGCRYSGVQWTPVAWRQAADLSMQLSRRRRGEEE